MPPHPPPTAFGLLGSEAVLRLGPFGADAAAFCFLVTLSLLVSVNAIVGLKRSVRNSPP